MALDPATVTAIENRFGETAIIQLTNRDSYESSSTVNEDVLERAVIQAQAFVRERCGPTEADEDNPRVIEIVPYFLMQPGTAQRSEVLTEWEAVYGKYRVRVAAPQTTAVPATSEDSRRRFTGDEYEALTIAARQRPDRSARGSW